MSTNRDCTAQGLQGGSGKRTGSVRRLHQTLPQRLGLGHDLWIVSELGTSTNRSTRFTRSETNPQVMAKGEELRERLMQPPD